MEIPTLKKVKERHDANVASFPDPDTLHQCTWVGDGKVKVASIICEPRWMEDGLPLEAGPR